MERFKRISSVSERLKEAMTASGKKQFDLSKETGLSHSSISRYISGVMEPKQRAIALLSKSLNVSEMWLWGYECPKERTSFIGSFAQAKNDVCLIPVLGRVAAGVPIEAVEEILGYEEISRDMAANGEHFALRIKGESMAPKMSDGDIVVVRRQPDVDNGQTAVVLVNGDEATVKRIKKSDAGIMLMPTNPAYEPMFYSNDEIEQLPVTIIGRVVELRAKL